MTDSQAGLRAVIAIHNTTLGPALGGIRIQPYASFEDALKDALRLAEGMTYKAAVAEVGFGGGKSVIIADPKTQKAPRTPPRICRRSGEVRRPLYLCRRHGLHD